MTTETMVAMSALAHKIIRQLHDYALKCCLAILYPRPLAFYLVTVEEQAYHIVAEKKKSFSLHGYGSLYLYA